MSNTYGEYSKSRITNIPVDMSSDEYKRLHNTIQHYPDEAVYIYSFKLNRMIYSDSWENVLGYKDDEINLLSIVESTTPEYAAFSNEINDKALKFLQTKQEHLEKYSFTLELKKFHKNGKQIPLIVRVGVYSSEQGRVTAIKGVNQVVNSLTLGKVMRYAAYGPNKSEFEEELNKQLFKYYAISKKEKEALEMAADGMAYKQIADALGVTPPAIEKRILPMFERFDVKSLPHLISFAYENHIIST